MDPTILTLSGGGTQLELVPDCGGAVLSWMRGATHIFRPALAGALASRSARGMASFPLVPYSNRIAKGRFAWRGQDYAIPATFGGNAIHGTGWSSAWHVTQQTPGAATLTLEQHADEFWPFPFHATLGYVLDASGLGVSIAVENRHRDAAPCGIGLHPFFPRDADTSLCFEASGVWLNTSDMIPERRTAVPPAWNFSTERRLGDAALDNCFTGFRSPARLRFPSRGHAITISGDALFADLVVYVPLQFDFCAVEPVSNMNDAINHLDSVPDHGLRVLQPGESLSGAMHFALEVLA